MYRDAVNFVSVWNAYTLHNGMSISQVVPSIIVFLSVVEHYLALFPIDFEYPSKDCNNVCICVA